MSNRESTSKAGSTFRDKRGDRGELGRNQLSGLWKSIKSAKALAELTESRSNLLTNTGQLASPKDYSLSSK
jgi:hypothetical protein